MLKCPYCSSTVNVEIQASALKKEKETEIQCSIVLKKPFEGSSTITLDGLKQLYNSYLMWKELGKLPYGQGQYFYDEQHEIVSKFELEEGKDKASYSFNIQTEDSPDGDIWVHRFIFVCHGRVDSFTIAGRHI